MGLSQSSRSGVWVSLVVLAGAVSASAAAWKDVPAARLGPADAERVLVGPHRVVELDLSSLRALLDGAPLERTEAARLRAPVLELPWPDGGTRRFAVEASPVMEPALAQRFPQIRTYRGRGLDDTSAVARLDLTPQGFHAIVLGLGGTVYVDPWSRTDVSHYVSYFKRDYRRRSGTEFQCHFDASDPRLTGERDLARHFGLEPRSFGDTLRTYRLAMAATQEYTTFHGGTVPAGLAAIVTAMNRVNGVYERDLAVHMTLVGNNNLLVYTAEPDPYTNEDGFEMLFENQANLDSVIGNANYDVGHVFSTGGGGIAGLGVVCAAGEKAQGVTGLGSPIGDPFYIDYVAHEVGHQFAGNHSFNGTSGSCGFGNREPSTAWEPGSGSTIMAYAGICGAENLQPNSDDLFHVGSLNEMQAFVSLGGGAACAAATPVVNGAPVVDAGPPFTIPQSTPFTLTGTASDPNGETLSFIWEELDLGAAAPPNTDNGNRPLFRSFNVGATPVRTFPRLSEVLSGTPVLGESLPTTNRTLNFRLTARDNHPSAGATSVDGVAVTVSAAAGPFVVTAPNTAVSWTGGSTQTVTWNVANTQAPPVSTANVRLSLSTDGGSTFPTVLAASTANDGSESLTVPNTPTSQARVKVEAVGNVFFDVSNVNFTIVAGTGPNASIGDATVLEGDASTTPAVFTVTLSASSPTPVTVNYATADGTATVGNNDYQAASGTLTFAPGQTARALTVSVVGDVAVEPDETFFVNLSALSGGGTITDAQGDGLILNDDGLGEISELTHGYLGRRTLASTAGQEKRDVYRLVQKPQSSYEVVVDEVSGDLSPLNLERVAAGGTAVLQPSLPAGVGFARSLRWENTRATEEPTETVRVRSGGCLTDCGAEDVYRIRAYETTLSVPRFNNVGSQVTVLILQNPTDATIDSTAYFWDASGNPLAQQAIAVPARNVVVTVTTTITGLVGTSGSITISHNGRHGELSGKTVALEPSTGFSFDSPMIVRPR